MAFHDAIQKSIVEGSLKFLDKDKKVILIDGDSLPEVVVNMTSVDLANMKIVMYKEGSKSLK